VETSEKAAAFIYPGGCGFPGGVRRCGIWCWWRRWWARRGSYRVWYDVFHWV